jgi:hypothetical protein
LQSDQWADQAIERATTATAMTIIRSENVEAAWDMVRGSSKARLVMVEYQRKFRSGLLLLNQRRSLTKWSISPIGGRGRVAGKTDYQQLS